MSYYQNGNSGTYYYHDCWGAEFAIYVFGGIIVFLLVIILICICWICCRKDSRRDGMFIYPMTQPITQPITQPMIQPQHGGVMYTQGPNCQHVQYQQHQPPAQVHVNAQRTSTAQPGHRNDVSECRNTAPQNTCLPLE